MQSAQETVTNLRQQHRKRSFSSGNFRKRDRNDLICVVCHAPAIGYNFDQITCESCKAFFRRNALNSTKKLKCRIGNNDCPITLETRKRCKYCRLKKCFEQGLRKEWIMSEEEKRTKKQKIEDNRRLRAMSQSLSVLSTSSFSPSVYSDEKSFLSKQKTSDETTEDENDNFKDLNDEDRSYLTKIEENYREAVRLNTSIIQGCDQPCVRQMNDIANLLNEPAHISALRMITFFKLTPEFNTLHEDDRLTLVKHNLLGVLYIHFVICTNVETEIFHEPNTPNDFCYVVGELRQYSDAVYENSMNLTRELQQLTFSDHLLMKLLMLTMIFSKGADTNEPKLREPERIFHTQNIFVQLLWNYIDVRFGSEQTASIFARLIFCCMKAHSVARLTKEIVASRGDVTDDLVPLMQSVLEIS